MSASAVCKVCNVIIVDSSHYVHEHEQSAQHRWVVAIRSIIGGQTQADLFRNLKFEQLKSETIPPELFQTLLIGQECITPVEDQNLGTGSSTNSNKWNCLLCGIVPPLSTIQMVDHLESKDHYILYMMTFHPKIYEKLKDMVKANLKVSQDGCIRLAGKDKKSLYEMYLQQEYQKLGPANLQNSALYWSDKMPRKCVGHVDVVKDILDKYKEKLENGYIPLENGILTTNPTYYNFQSRLGDAMGQQMELFQMAQSGPGLNERQKLSVTESSKLQATIIELLQHFLLGTPHSFMDKAEADHRIKDQQAKLASQQREEEIPGSLLEGHRYVNGISKPIETKLNTSESKTEAECQSVTTSIPSTITTAKPSLLQKYLKSEVLKYMNKNKAVAGITCAASQINGVTPTAVVATGSMESQSGTTTNAYGSVVTANINSQKAPPVRGQRGAVVKKRRAESSSSSASSTNSDRGSSGSSRSGSSSSRASSSYKARKRRSGRRYSAPAPDHYQPTRARNDSYNGVGPTPLMNWVDPNPQAALLSMMVMGAAAASSNMMMLNNNNPLQQRRAPLPSSSHFTSHLTRGGGRATHSRDVEGDRDPTRFVYSDERECFVEVNDLDYCFMDTRFNVTHQQLNYNDNRHDGSSDLNFDRNYAGESHGFWNNNFNASTETEWTGQREKQSSPTENDEDKYDPFAQQDAGIEGSDQD